jgi:hypothetical protein
MSETRQELVNVVRQVRNRWRQRMLLRGGIIFLVGAIVAIALASYGLQAWKFSPQSVTWLRVGVFAVFALLLGVWLIRPMGRKVSDLQVALYVEEHEPSLQAAILSAVDVARAADAGESEVPAVIVEKMIAQAVEKAKSIEGGRAVGRKALRLSAIALGTIAGLVALSLAVGRSSCARAHRRSSICPRRQKLPALTPSRFCRVTWKCRRDRTRRWRQPLRASDRTTWPCG